jgi:hypothetical protein
VTTPAQLKMTAPAPSRRARMTRNSSLGERRAMVAEIEWKSTETTPPKNRRILIGTASGAVKTGSGYRTASGTRFVCDDNFLIPCVVAWAELPIVPHWYQGASGSSEVSIGPDGSI